jgi:hypothetical protein
MQYDVKSSFRTTDGAMVAYRTRLKGVFFAVTSPGADIIIYDNASGASGNVLLTLPCDVAGQHNVYIPGEGILAQNGIFLDINGSSGVTVFYG